MTNQEVIEILLNEQKCLDRNDGIQCDRKCESCDLVMDVETIREAYSMAISALQAQDLQPTCNNLATDTISKRAAIDAIVNTVSEIGLHDNSEVARYGATFRQHEIIDIIEGMPCAQPDGIPLEWIDKHLEWLDNCDNDFAQLAKVSIRAMVEIWKKDKT